MQTSYRLNNTTLSAAAAAGATTITVASASNFVAGDKITVDQAANGFGKGDPETRTITAIAGGRRIHARRTAQPRARHRPLRRGLARRHPTHDTQGSNLGWWYTEKDGAQTARPHLYWGWRYLQILPPGAGEDLTADDISAVVQHQPRPRSARRRSTPTTRRSTRSSS